MSRVTHPVEQEEVMAYLDGELESERAANVASHLKECAECQALAAELRLVSQQAAAWQAEPAPPQLAARVTAALAEHTRDVVRSKPERRRPWLRRWIWGFASASAAVLVIFAIAIPNLLRSRHSADLSVSKTGLEALVPRSPAQLADRAVPFPGRGGEAEFGQVASPMIARTATLVVVSKEFEGARAAVEQIVRQQQGYIAQLSLQSPAGAARSLSATLRVPAERLDAALAELKKLGRVELESRTGEEVTEQYVDLQARLSNARNTEQRLIEVLRQRTGKVKDILEVEQEIARVREEIERMDAQRKSLENRVRFATVQLQLTEEHKAALEVTSPSTPVRLWNEMVAGWRSAVESVIGLLAFLLRYGPSLLLWLLLLYWPARLVWRRLRASAQ